MRIVKRAEFLTLPPHTWYRQAREPFSFGDVTVKYDSLTDDWFCQELDSPENDGTIEWGERLYEMLKNGASFPLETDTVRRDGLFDQNDIFLIYEKDDLVRYRVELDKAIEAAPEPPPRPADYLRPPE